MSILSILQRGCLMLLALALAACGGGGSSGTAILGGGSGGGSGSAAAASLQIKFTPTSVDNTGTQNVVATVTALDANGQGVKGVVLTLKVDKNATYAITSATGSTTGADGTVTANVTIGNDYSARSITMTATDGTLTKSASFDVTASRQLASDLILTVTPRTLQNSVANTATVTATAVDANRNALSGIPVTFTVDNGATLTPSGTVTSTGGTVTGLLGIGSDLSSRTITITATSGTVVRTATVQVQGAKLTASGFASTVASNSTGNSITYLLVDNAGAKMAGYPISVSSSSSAATATGTTDADGRFTYRFNAPAAAGVITVAATAAGVTDTETITVTTLADPDPARGPVRSASVSVSPNVVLVNATGSTANKTELRALFLGDNNAPIQNVRVWFDLNGDALSVGGTIGSAADGKLLYSDANGVARTTYAPGTRSSPKDGVTVRVCWDVVRFDPATSCPNQSTNTLTITDDSVSVSIGANGTIGIGTSGVTYTKRFAVQVVDAAGQAKAGVQISPSIDLLAYYKGEWVVPVGGTAWIQAGRGNRYPTIYPGTGATVPAAGLSPFVDTLDVLALGNMTVCGNEDLNRNGVAELFQDQISGTQQSEDQNDSANSRLQRPALDPRKADVSISVEGSSTTDTNGVVVLKIEYPQNVGSWLKYNVVVSASGISGTEGRANFVGILPVLAAAVTDIKASPPFQYSPYGTQGSDTFLRKNVLGQSDWLCVNPN